MTRKLKALGLALMAASALSAVMASAALAFDSGDAQAKFTAGVGGSETTRIDGGQIGTNTLTVNGLAVTCLGSSYFGTFLSKGSAAERITFVPEYSLCHVVVPILGTQEVTFTTHSCEYTLTATTTITSGGVKDLSAHTDFGCSAFEPMEIYVYSLGKIHAPENALCVYDVLPAENERLTGITLTNKTNEPASRNDIEADLSVPLAIVRTKGSEAFCGKEHQTATWAGKITLQATNEAKALVNVLASE